MTRLLSRAAQMKGGLRKGGGAAAEWQSQVPSMTMKQLTQPRGPIRVHEAGLCRE